jgi:1,4-alpha-glucan branching enzyme
MVKEGIRGVNFAVWAPNAQRVSVVGPFNHWDGRCHQMRLLGESGIREIFIPDLCEGELYKYEIRAKNGDVFIKTDPYAFHTEVSPDTSGIVYELKGKHEWCDSEWMEKRSKTSAWEPPFSIYKADITSWLSMPGRNDNLATYKHLAMKLISYVKNKGITHIELSNTGQPNNQISSFYIPDTRYGKPEDFMAFVDICHQNNVGVILNWIPPYAAMNAQEPEIFDSARLYDHDNSMQPGAWSFNYSNSETRNYLIANALFWTDIYHIDGLRADTVASNLYMDYLKKEHEKFSRVNIIVEDYVTKRAISEKDIQKITEARHNASHTVLGPHYLEGESAMVIRAFLPPADQVYVLGENHTEIIHKMNKIHQDGLFELVILEDNSNFKYRFQIVDKEGNARILHDPYAITSPAFSEFDRYLFAQGNHYDIFDKLGAHMMVKEGIRGVNFAVWAPNAQRVSVVGSFNHWDGRCHQMRLLGESGIREIFIPDLCEGELYKYEINQVSCMSLRGSMNGVTVNGCSGGLKPISGNFPSQYTKCIWDHG